MSRLVAAYVESLVFEDVVSPYDLFLEKNGLPPEPRKFESPAVYVARLRTSSAAHGDPELVTDADGTFQLHQQPFVFGPLGAEGLRIFLDRTRGNCVACHLPPSFTDFAFHNTGVAQEDYDAVHGDGQLRGARDPENRGARPIPTHSCRPPPRILRRGTLPGRAVVRRPERADLGVWNYLDPDYPARLPAPSRAPRLRVAGSARPRRRSPDAPSRRIGLFKTPGLRDLGHSQPYLHTGPADTLEDIVSFYVTASGLPRARSSARARRS